MLIIAISSFASVFKVVCCKMRLHVGIGLNWHFKLKLLAGINCYFSLKWKFNFDAELKYWLWVKKNLLFMGRFICLSLDLKHYGNTYSLQKNCPLWAVNFSLHQTWLQCLLGSNLISKHARVMAPLLVIFCLISIISCLTWALIIIFLSLPN